jgi:hypothetical protein
LRIVYLLLITSLFLFGLSTPSRALDLSFDGWIRYGYNWGYDQLGMDDHEFYWMRLNLYGGITDDLSYYIRFHELDLDIDNSSDPLDPFKFEPIWYYLSWKTSIGRLDFGRVGVIPSINEEIRDEINGIYGTMLVFHPELPQGFSGSLALNYDDFSDGSRWAYLGQLDYAIEKWRFGLNYGYNPAIEDNPMIIGANEDPTIYSLEISYNLTSALSLNFELGRDVGIIDTMQYEVDELNLVAVRYIDPQWMVFAGYNFPREHYALDVMYFVHPNFALRAEYNNSYANMSPGLQLSFYFMYNGNAF